MRAGAILHSEIVRSVLDRDKKLGSMLVNQIWGAAVERFGQETCSVGVLKLGHACQVPGCGFVSTYCSPLEVVGYLRGA